MCSDDSVSAPSVQLREDRLGDRSAGGRLGARAELVDEHEGAVVRPAEHVLHVHEERTVCTEVVVYRLVVSDVHHHAVEYHHLRSLRSRDQHAPLEHILKKSDSLQADRLTSGIRAGNQKYVLLFCQSRGQRHDLLSLLLERALKKRVSRLAQIHLSIFRDYRHSGDEIQRYLRLGHDEVGLAEIFRSLEQFRNIWPEELSELEEYAHDLALLRELQLLDLIVQLHHFCRLDESRLSRS